MKKKAARQRGMIGLGRMGGAPLSERGDILLDGGSSCFGDGIGRAKSAGLAEEGCLHGGPNGAGHFVTRVRNGLEYGVKAAYAAGLAVLRRYPFGGPTAELIP